MKERKAVAAAVGGETGSGTELELASVVPVALAEWAELEAVEWEVSVAVATSVVVQIMSTPLVSPTVQRKLIV